MQTPQFWYRPSGFLSTLIAPLSLLYAAGRALDVMRAKPVAFGANVICIGNLVAGGAGKTPTALALASLLQQQGYAPHFVTRGYGGTETGPHTVTAADGAAQVGDEALLLAACAPTTVARDRVAGIRAAQLARGDRPAVTLLDDGLQNTGLAAGTNILVVDGAVGFGNGQLLPAGPLRETLSAAKARLSAAIVIGDDVQNVAALLAPLPVFRARLATLPVEKMTGLPFAAFTGLGRPQKFFDSAHAAGLNVIATKSYADHYAYSAGDVDALLAWAKQHQAQLLTTAKDAVRLPDALRAQVAVLPVALHIDDAPALVAWLTQRINHG